MFTHHPTLGPDGDVRPRPVRQAQGLHRVRLVALRLRDQPRSVPVLQLRTAREVGRPGCFRTRAAVHRLRPRHGGWPGSLGLAGLRELPGCGRVVDTDLAFGLTLPLGRHSDMNQRSVPLTAAQQTSLLATKALLRGVSVQDALYAWRAEEVARLGERLAEHVPLSLWKERFPGSPANSRDALERCYVRLTTAAAA